MLQQHLPFTVLKLLLEFKSKEAALKLQQHLPFTVLKLIKVVDIKGRETAELQQHLPFTVLKL